MKARILVVEDEEHLAFALEFNLTEEGYCVEVASNLAEARRLGGGQFELIILDVMLPDGNGVEWCQALRRLGDKTPVLFLTAKGALVDVVRGLDAGGDDYVSKPFELQELLGRISALLRRRAWDRPPGEAPRVSPEPATEYQFGGNAVDLSTREIRVPTGSVELTDLEFRMLRYFLENPRRVVSREELLRNVWGVSPDSNTRTVDVFVARLRRIFERDPSRPDHFVTVRGAGYRFNPAVGATSEEAGR